MHLHLVTESRRGAVYDIYSDGSGVSEYRKFIDNVDFQQDEEYLTIRGIAERLRSARDVSTNPFRESGNFRDESCSRCKDLVAIPPSGVSTGLRFFCLLLQQRRTLIFCGGFDKRGWVGSYEESAELRPLYNKVVDACAAIQRTIDYGIMDFNDQAGYGFFDTEGRIMQIDLDHH